MSMKILVTGSAGFIGFHTTKKFLEMGIRVVGLDNINDYYDVNLKYARLAELGIGQDGIADNVDVVSDKYPGHSFIKCDLQNKQIMRDLFALHKFGYVCHLAAQAGVRYSLINPDSYISSNIVGFLNILECCREFNVKHLSYASSSSVYGLNKKQPFSTYDNVDHPINLYAASKKSNELMAHSYSYLFKLPTTGLRFFTVYGPWGRPDMSPFLFADAIFKDKTIDVFNFGDMQRDFTYIDDIVKGVVAVTLKPALPGCDVTDSEASKINLDPSISIAPYKIYNIGNSNPIKLMDFIAELEKNIGKDAKKNFMPLQAGDMLKTYADVSDLEKDFNYKPDTSISLGVEKFIKWYKLFYNV